MEILSRDILSLEILSLEIRSPEILPPEILSPEIFSSEMASEPGAPPLHPPSVYTPEGLRTVMQVYILTVYSKVLADVAERRSTRKSTTRQNQTPQPSVLKENKTNPTKKGPL